MIRRLLIVALLLVFSTTVMAGAADLAALVPDDASFVLHGNLTKLFAQEAVKKFLDGELAKQTPEEKTRFEEFKTKTGFDPYKNLTEATLYVSKAASTNPQDFGAVLFNGTFDGAKLVQAMAERDQTAVEQFEGCNALKPRKGGEEMLVVLDTNTLILGFAPGIKKVVDVKNGKAKGVTANPQFAAMLKKADTAASVWGAGMLPEELKAQLKKDGPAPFLAESAAILFSLNMDKGVTATFLGEFAKPEAQEAAFKAYENFVTALKPLADGNKATAELLQAMKAEKVEGGLKVSATLTVEQFESVKKQLMEMAQGTPAKK